MVVLFLGSKGKSSGWWLDFSNRATMSKELVEREIEGDELLVVAAQGGESRKKRR